MFRVIALLEDPRPLMKTQFSNTGLNTSLQNSFIMKLCTAPWKLMKAPRYQKQQSNPTALWNLRNIWLKWGCSFSWKLQLVFGKHSTDQSFQRAAIMAHQSTEPFPQNDLGLCGQVLQSSRGLSYVSPLAVESSWAFDHISLLGSVPCGANWNHCSSPLLVNLKLFGSRSWSFFNHSNQPPTWSLVSFSLLTMF